MQKVVLSFLVILALAGVTTSCKKDKAASSQEKILGTWNMDKAYTEISISGQSQKDTTVFENGEYLEFKSNGTVIAHSDTEDTSTWEITGTKLKVVDEDGPQEFDIQQLTDKELTLYSKESEGSDFFQTTLHLKR